MAPSTRGKVVDYKAQLHAYDHLENDSSSEEDSASTRQETVRQKSTRRSTRQGRSFATSQGDLRRRAVEASTTRVVRRPTQASSSRRPAVRPLLPSYGDLVTTASARTGDNPALDESVRQAAFSAIKESPYGSDYASTGQPPLFSRLPAHTQVGNGRLAAVRAVESAVPLDLDVPSARASTDSQEGEREGADEDSTQHMGLPSWPASKPSYKQLRPLPLYHPYREDPWVLDPPPKPDINIDPVTGKSDEALGEFIHSRFVIPWEGEYYSIKPLSHCCREPPPADAYYFEAEAYFTPDFKQQVRICEKHFCEECQGYWAWDLMMEEERKIRLRFGMPETVWMEIDGQYPEHPDTSDGEEDEGE